MSATKNTDSLAAQAGGEFRSRVPASEPLTTKGHAPGVKVGNDAVSEFRAETHPPGTAPPERTFQPDPGSVKIPARGALDPDAEDESGTRTVTDPLADLPGATTSRDVHNATEFNRPARDGGLEGGSDVAARGGSAETGDGSVEAKVRSLGADLG